MSPIARLLLVAALVVAALGVPLVSSTTAQTREVNVYSSRHYDTDRTLYDNFTQQTGIRVNLIEGTEDQLIERIRNEGANSPADVLITVDAGRLWRAQQAGILQPVVTETLATRIPEHLRDPEGYWWGLTKRARVIVYAKDRVDPAELPTYESLADPKWRGRIVVRSSSHVYNQSLVGSLIEALGPEATEAWARGLVANFARPPQGGDLDQLKAVAAGEADIAISNTYYLARMLKSNDVSEREAAARLGVIFPNQNDRGTHVNISGAGVVATARNRDNAIAFIEYLTSDSAQDIFARGNAEYPAVPGVPLDPVLESWGPFKEDTLNAAHYAANSALALMIMDRAGWR
ncbi:MAG: Fe(3+) ABC transporter substrate-binding protein [Chloroflexi bacterium]|nr:Fe(3+) ABC transporter substrate-binding protein [Chloroflexota bacterium]